MNAHQPAPTPAAVEFERALLGCMMLEPECVSEIGEYVDADSFYRPDHGRLFALMLAMHRRGEPVELLSVGESVLANDRGGDGQAFGGYGYVLGLVEGVPSRVAWRYYAAQVRDLAGRRRVLRALDEIRDLAADTTTDAADVEAAIIRAAEVFRAQGTDDWTHIADAARRVVDHAAAAERGDAPSLGIAMPLGSLAAVVPSLEYGEVALIAARPAMGKSALARCIAEGVAVSPSGDGDRLAAVGLFTFEMSSEQVGRNALASWSGVPASDLRAGRMEQERAWDDVIAAEDRLGKAGLYVYDGETPTIEVLSAKARGLVRRAWRDGYRLRMIVVDYVQLMRASRGMERANRNEQLSHISRGLKDLARSLGIAVVALSQLSREVEQRGNKKPQLSDLRDSGALEQDAAVVMFPFRPAVYAPDHDPEEATVFVQKNRYGPIGDAPLRWVGRFARFESAGRVSGVDL